jgi:hypothetical protein
MVLQSSICGMNSFRVVIRRKLSNVGRPMGRAYCRKLTAPPDAPPDQGDAKNAAAPARTRLLRMGVEEWNEFHGPLEIAILRKLNSSPVAETSKSW